MSPSISLFFMVCASFFLCSTSDTQRFSLSKRRAYKLKSSVPTISRCVALENKNMFAVILTLSTLSLLLNPFFLHSCIAEGFIVFHMHSSAEQRVFSFCVSLSITTVLILLKIISLRINSMSLKMK